MPHFVQDQQGLVYRSDRPGPSATVASDTALIAEDAPSAGDTGAEELTAEKPTDTALEPGAGEA